MAAQKTRLNAGDKVMTRKVKAISPVQAWDLLQNNQRAILIDVRSSMEYLFVGHPQGSVHVAWIDEPDWIVNPEFVTEVRKVLLGGVGLEEHRTDAPVVLICRSGKRSLEAGKLLIDIDEGFEGELDADHHRSTVGGWRYHGLPWEQC
jgi:rhodanese-related sulfurtransferase